MNGEVRLHDLLALLDEARGPVAAAIRSAEDVPELDFSELRRLLRSALRLLGDDEVTALIQSLRAAARLFERELPAGGPLPMSTPRLSCSILSERQVQQTKPA
jgi:hypothetical protein